MVLSCFTVCLYIHKIFNVLFLLRSNLTQLLIHVYLSSLKVLLCLKSCATKSSRMNTSQHLSCARTNSHLIRVRICFRNFLNIPLDLPTRIKATLLVKVIQQHHMFSILLHPSPSKNVDYQEILIWTFRYCFTDFTHNFLYLFCVRVFS